MVRLIDADAFLEEYCEPYPHIYQAMSRAFKDAPTVDAVPTEALRLFVNWAEECGFGYDNIPEQYERYKDRLEDMGYIEGLMHIAIWEAERKEK